MIELGVELDDALLEKYLDDEDSSTEGQLKKAIRKGTIARECYPVLCGAALRNIGVQRLLDAVIDYLPSPTEVPEVQGVHPRDADHRITRPHDDTEPFSALVFKVVADSHGDLTYLRIYSGKLAKGDRVINPVNGKKENISRIYEMHAKDRIALDVVGAGNIVAVIGVKDSYTGDTLCDPNELILLEKMDFPEPVISMSIEPRTNDDKRKLSEGLVTIRREDPSFHSHYDDETGQTIIAGMGELHLEIIKNKLIRDMKIGVDVGRPRVSYREAIQGPATGVRGKFVKQTGGRGQYGDVTINLEPFTEGQAQAEGLKFTDNIAFENKIVGGAIPKEYIPSVEAGIRQTAISGVTAGYPLINIKATLIDGSSHQVDSSQVAFEQAGRLALRAAVARAGPIPLVPGMQGPIPTPQSVPRRLIRETRRHSGMIMDTSARAYTKIITCEVPLSEMFGYTTILRGLTQGRATSTMEFLAYRPMPAKLTKEVLAAD